MLFPIGIQAFVVRNVTRNNDVLLGLAYASALNRNNRHNNQWKEHGYVSNKRTVYGFLLPDPVCTNSAQHRDIRPNNNPV